MRNPNKNMVLIFNFKIVLLDQFVLLIQVKNRAWSPPVPVPSGSVTFFTSTFTSTEVPLFFDKLGKCYIWLRPYRHLCHSLLTSVIKYSPLSQCTHLCHRVLTSVTVYSPLSQCTPFCLSSL